MKRMRSVIARLLAVALGAAPLALSGGCERKQAAAGETNAAAPVPVKLADVIVRPAPRTVEVVGTLYGDEETTISNKVPGKVIAIFHDIGDRVKPGEPLAQLLQKDYELDVQQKTMTLRQALSKLGLTEVPPADFDVTTLPSVKKAWLEMENAQAKWQRGKELHDQR